MSLEQLLSTRHATNVSFDVPIVGITQNSYAPHMGDRCQCKCDCKCPIYNCHCECACGPKK